MDLEFKAMKKALEKTASISNTGDRAKAMLAYIDMAKELYSDFRGDGGADLSDSQTLPVGQGLGRIVTDAKMPNDALMFVGSDNQPKLVTGLGIPEPPAMPRRIVQEAQRRELDYRTTEEISQWLHQAAPATIEVPIAGGKPMVLRRDVKTRPELKMVRLSYIPAQGDEDPPFATLMTSDEHLNLDLHMAELYKAVQMKYSAVARKIEPKIQPAQTFSMANSIGGEAEENAGDYLRNPEATGKAQAWANSRTPEEMAFIRGGR
jgi:hypothetical protein